MSCKIMQQSALLNWSGSGAKIVVSLESILPLYEESVRIDYVESVFNWKGAAQRSRFAYIPWAINLKRGPGAAPLKWTPGPIVEFGGNDSPKMSDQI